MMWFGLFGRTKPGAYVAHVQQQVEEQRMKLLEAQEALDYATAMVQYRSMRLMKLQRIAEGENAKQSSSSA